MPLAIRRLALALAAIVLSSQPAWPGGDEGHQTVGAVAEQLLQQHPTIRDWVKQILGDAPLSQAAIGADCAKVLLIAIVSHTPRNKTRRILKG